METIKQYRALELGRLCNGAARIKTATNTAQTKFINVTAEELEKIKAILLCER